MRLVPTTRIKTPVGTAHLLPDRGTLASGFLEIAPRLCERHAAPTLTVFPGGRVEVASLFLYGPLVKFLEQEVRQAVAPHLTAFGAEPVPTGWQAIQRHVLYLDVAGGSARISEEAAYLSVSWEREGISRSWALWHDTPAALDLDRFPRLKKADRDALTAFHDHLGLAYREETPEAPLGIALASLRHHVRVLTQVRHAHQQYWSQFALDHLREALAMPHP